MVIYHILSLSEVYRYKSMDLFVYLYLFTIYIYIYIIRYYIYVKHINTIKQPYRVQPN